MRSRAFYSYLRQNPKTLRRYPREKNWRAFIFASNWTGRRSHSRLNFKEHELHLAKNSEAIEKSFERTPLIFAHHLFPNSEKAPSTFANEVDSFRRYDSSYSKNVRSKPSIRYDDTRYIIPRLVFPTSKKENKKRERKEREREREYCCYQGALLDRK